MNREKSVDESWKESAAQEKERLENIARLPVPQSGTYSAGQAGAGSANRTSPRENPPGATPSPADSRQQPQPQDVPGPAHEEPSGDYEANFINYISGLAYQAMVFMGEIPNPVTNTNEKNLEQAKFVIETLILLQEKTKGNLTRKESDMLNTAAYELQMKFVEISQKETV